MGNSTDERENKVFRRKEEGISYLALPLLVNLLSYFPDDEVDLRVYSILAYFVVIVIIGLPVWWYTTRVYRSELPMDHMYQTITRNHTDKEFGIPLSLEYDVLISLVHPYPGNLNIDLKGENIDENLQPFLKKISSIADFKVKSQWLYFTELGAIPTKVGDHYALQENQLPHIITPLEIKLWSHLSSRPTINLVVYISHCDIPLHIYDHKNHKLDTNAFLSPRWGGIFIINPDQTACDNKQFTPSLQDIVSTFITQLKHLFKIDSTSEDDIFELKNRKASKMLDSTQRTLKSLAQLLSEISSIVISDKVGEKINIAVENADLAEEYLKKGDIDNGLKYAKLAFHNSEGAFSDPSLLALLYFPEDQK